MWCCRHGVAIVRVQQVHLTNVKQHYAAVNSQAIHHVVECTYRLLSTISTIDIYFYLSVKLILVFPSRRR